MQFSSLEDVWGASFPKKSHSMTHKVQHPEDKRDAEKEARVFPTPQHRSQHNIQKHKKTIDDLSKSLPISENDEESNFAPALVPSSNSKLKEHFTSTKSGYSNPYYPMDTGTDFPYAPPSFQMEAHDLKLNHILKMINDNQIGSETPATQDMLLYIFTGVFFLFTFDTFVNLGRRLK